MAILCLRNSHVLRMMSCDNNWTKKHKRVSTVQVSDSVGSLLNSEGHFLNSPAARWRLFAARLKL
jgi:hypothetical protein